MQSNSMKYVESQMPPTYQQTTQSYQQYPQVQQPVIIGTVPLSLGQDPTRLTCPHCSSEILTTVKYKSGLMTWAVIGGICMFGLVAPCVWFGCQFIPCCIQDLKDADHSCPNCKIFLGTYRKLQ